jgi:predicted MFS family arabinose efflux permease
VNSLGIAKPGRAASVAIAAGAALALADGSIVVLALPELLSALDTGVEGVAAVIGVYTTVLALALLPADALRRRLGPARVGAMGLTAFGLASLACGFAGSLPLMLVMRGIQAIGGAAVLVAAFALLDAGHRRGGAGRLWMLAAIGGAAAGPALGGALTQAFGWSAIFFAQVPVALASALVCSTATHARSEGLYRSREVELADSGLRATPRWLRWRAIAALGLLSAALTAVLFLLVLVIVAGWSYEPLAGAAILTVLPVAAIAGMRVRGDPRVRAAAGSLLVAGGVAALAAIVTASAWWAIAPELAAGMGMGLALPALSESLLPERTPSDAARVLTARHVGITVALVVLAPLIATRLETAIEQARDREVAVLLDARLDPLSKIDLVGHLVGGVGEDDPRADLDRSFAELSADVPEDQRAQVDATKELADQTVITAVSDTFRPAFGVAGAFALAAALLLMPPHPVRRLLPVAGIALAVPLITTAVAIAVRPTPVALADPCESRTLPDVGGITGVAQDVALRGVDLAACRFGSTREELVLALANEDDASRYEDEYGVNPRSPSSVLSNLLEGVPGADSVGSLLDRLTP